MACAWTGAAAWALVPGNLAAATPPPPALPPAPASTAAIVTSLSVSAPASVDAGSVLEQVRQRKGEPLRMSVLNQDLKRIWRLGKFEDVSVETHPGPAAGVAVVFVVSSRPLIEDVRFYGNKNISDSTLKDKAGLTLKQPYDQAKAAAAVLAIRDEYKTKNYYAAQVRIETQAGSRPGWVIVNVHVDEGNAMEIQKILVTGNHALTADQIRAAMQDTSVEGWFTGGSYDPDKVFEDFRRVLKLYASHGYVRATLGGVNLRDWGTNGKEVVRDSTDFDQADKRIVMRLKIHEGTQFHLSKVTFTGSSVFSDHDLRAGMASLQTPGHVFDQVAFEADMKKLGDRYAAKGYIYCQIAPHFTWDRRRGTVAVRIDIRQGSVAYIEAIRIRGNEVTKDHVIRRVLVLKPGDPYNADTVEADKERIQNLGFFDEVTTDVQPGSEMDKVVLIFNVTERKTGTLSLGAGYSSVEGLVGFLQVSQNNLFGDGNAVSAQWDFGSSMNSYSLSYTDPWIFDKPVSLGVDLFNTQQNPLYNYQGFDLQSTGGSINTGYLFKGTPYQMTLSYRYETDLITNVQAGIIGITDGLTHLSVVTPGLIRDTRDNIFNPTTGTLNSLTMELAGGFLGGDDSFVKPVYDTRLFFDTPAVFGQKWMRLFVLGLHARVGWATTFSDGGPASTVPTSERFFVGGVDDVRGYDERSLGASGVGGGVYEFITNVQYGFNPIKPLQLYVFYDAGNTWWSAWNKNPVPEPNDYSYAGINANLNPSTWRNLYLYPATGVGLLFTIPGSVIQIRLDWGYGLDANARILGDVNNGRVDFNIGNIF